MENPPVEFLRRDWTLLGQLVDILEPFEEATKWLSFHDASISMVVPIVTSITESLKTTSADHGVITMKRALMEAMNRRFAHVEEDEHYTIASFLDIKYRGHFFQNEGVAERTKAAVIQKLKEELRKHSRNEVSCDWQSHFSKMTMSINVPDLTKWKVISLQLTLRFVSHQGKLPKSPQCYEE